MSLIVDHSGHVHGRKKPTIKDVLVNRQVMGYNVFIEKRVFDKVVTCFFATLLTPTLRRDRIFFPNPLTVTGFTCCHPGESGQPTYQCSHPQKSDPPILQPVQIISGWCCGGDGVCSDLGYEMRQSIETVGTLTNLISNVS